MKLSTIALLALLGLGACGSSPEPDYYTLKPIDGLSMPTVPIVVEIRRPGLAPGLDRPEIVRNRGYEVDRDEARLWAEPLDTMIERTLAIDLSQRLPDSTTVTETGGIAADPTFVVDIEIQQLEGDHEGQSLLSGQLAISRAGAPAIPLAHLTLRGKKGDSPAEGYSLLVGQLADKIATLLQSQPGIMVPSTATE